jgi:hypothetical protein
LKRDWKDEILRKAHRFPLIEPYIKEKFLLLRGYVYPQRQAWWLFHLIWKRYRTPYRIPLHIPLCNCPYKLQTPYLAKMATRPTSPDIKYLQTNPGILELSAEELVDSFIAEKFQIGIVRNPRKLRGQVAEAASLATLSVIQTLLDTGTGTDSVEETIAIRTSRIAPLNDSAAPDSHLQVRRATRNGCV